jgi:allantoinase
VSSPEGITLIADARTRGVDVSAETCPHYLLLNEDDVVRIGATAKCFPLLRPEASRCDLWRRLEAGAVATIGSDHSPAPPDMKVSKDFFAIWGGISGCQHGFPLLLSEALARDAGALPRFAALLAANVAARFKLPNKGRLAVGYDADFGLLAIGRDQTLRNTDLLYRYRQGPYDGRPCRVSVTQTFVRGHRVWGKAGIAPGASRGQFLRPTTT